VARISGPKSTLGCGLCPTPFKLVLCKTSGRKGSAERKQELPNGLSLSVYRGGEDVFLSEEGPGRKIGETEAQVGTLWSCHLPGLHRKGMRKVLNYEVNPESNLSTIPSGTETPFDGKKKEGKGFEGSWPWLVSNGFRRALRASNGQERDQERSETVKRSHRLSTKIAKNHSCRHPEWSNVFRCALLRGPMGRRGQRKRTRVSPGTLRTSPRRLTR